MKNLALAKARASHESVEELKSRTFKHRIEKDYNREIIHPIDDDSDLFKVIIQTSRLADNIDYKKLSAPLDTNIKTGDIIHWEREETNWLIYLRRSTEKNYFLGEMREAQHTITWRDEYGQTYSQLGSFSRQDPSVIKDMGYITTVNFQYLDGTATIMLQDNDISRKLKRYDKFIIEGNVWEVRGYDSTTYKNIIMFYLEESERNQDTELDNIPEGKIEKATVVESNLNGVLEVLPGDRKTLHIKTKLNGSTISGDSYKIMINGSELVGREIVFSEEGLVEIKIISIKTGVEQDYTIEVKPEAAEKIGYLIVGQDTITTSLSYNYEIKMNINGSMEDVVGEWTIESATRISLMSTNPKSSKSLKSLNGSACRVKASRSGTAILYCKVEDETVATKEINIRSLMDTN